VLPGTVLLPPSPHPDSITNALILEINML